MLNDVITTKTWQTICDYIYCPVDGYDKVPEGGTVWVSLDDVLDFFDKIRGTERKYILVSSHSDFGLEYQKDNSPNDDLIRTLKLACHQIPNLGYTGAQIPPVCNTSECNLSDTYSIKCYRFTKATFDKIPDEVCHWYLANNTIKDTRLTTIPFGIQENHEKYFENFKPPEEKINKIYVNFGNTTLERVLLKEELKKKNYVYYRESPLSYQDYLNEISQYKYALCPPGNGLDSYRVLEALYCGCWPIYTDCWYNMLGLPGLDYQPNYYDYAGRKLQTVISESEYISNQFEKTKLSYWKSQIEQKRKELL